MVNGSSVKVKHQCNRNQFGWKEFWLKIMIRCAIMPIIIWHFNWTSKRSRNATCCLFVNSLNDWIRETILRTNWMVSFSESQAAKRIANTVKDQLDRNWTGAILWHKVFRDSVTTVCAICLKIYGKIDRNAWHRDRRVVIIGQQDTLF